MSPTIALGRDFGQQASRTPWITWPGLASPSWGLAGTSRKREPVGSSRPGLGLAAWLGVR